ncbi:hypothetical protein N7471_013373 [Penicillium samsonianum]|uniref:uncharacterized protein n=1 Tax=Penicillium samsonianum TaxID=1882272 RepID=UPI002548E6F6|nr:uncharacterized protein N7471_013373 [Penicillium samsonianum]KAJ6118753.1 hypothetical protein N7471_013373 [Penicillium samsonianum]
MQLDVRLIQQNLSGLESIRRQEEAASASPGDDLNSCWANYVIDHVGGNWLPYCARSLEEAVEEVQVLAKGIQHHRGSSQLSFPVGYQASGRSLSQGGGF